MSEKLTNSVRPGPQPEANLGYLYYSPYRWAYSSKAHGFFVNPLGNYHLEDVWLS